MLFITWSPNHPCHSYPAFLCQAWRRPSHRAWHEHDLLKSLWVTSLPWVGLSCTPPVIEKGRYQSGKHKFELFHFEKCLRIRTLTILLLISWKWISQTFSTTSSFSNVTNPNPEERKSPDTQTAVYIWISILAVIINNVYSSYTSVQLQVSSTDAKLAKKSQKNKNLLNLKSTMILPCFLDVYQGSTIVYITYHHKIQSLYFLISDKVGSKSLRPQITSDYSL